MRAAVTGSHRFSIGLPCVDFLRSPFSIRIAEHSVEILSSIGLKVLPRHQPKSEQTEFESGA